MGQAMIAESFAKKEALIFTKIKLGDGIVVSRRKAQLTSRI